MGTEAPVEPGERMGRYTVERVLGDGGFAAVVLARHDVLHSLHALKLLHAEHAARPGIRERFLAEGRILAQLRHPNLVRVSDIVEDATRVALVMEFVEGRTLAGLIEGGPLPPAAALALMDGILAGIHHAHEHGIVHRDLKPENVIVVDDHGTPRPVVLDFGIAKIGDGERGRVEAGDLRKTSVGTRMGTPQYMSPEQIASSAEVDRRSDVFALGAILVELLVGEPAFQGSTTTEILLAISRGEVRGLDRIADPGLRAIATRALAPRPEDRFPDAAAFRAALSAEPALPPAREARQTLADTLAHRAPPERHRDGRGASDGAAPGALDAGPTPATPPAVLPASTSPAPATPPARRAAPVTPWLLLGCLGVGVGAVMAVAALVVWLVLDPWAASALGLGPRTPEPLTSTATEDIAPEAPGSPAGASSASDGSATVSGPDATSGSPGGASAPDGGVGATDGPSTPALAPPPLSPAPSPGTTTPAQPAPAPSAPKPPAPRPPPSKPSPPAPPAPPSDDELVRDAWRAVGPQVRACAAVQTNGAAKVWKISVQFGRNGNPTAVTVSGLSPDPPLAACLEQAARGVAAGRLSAPVRRVFTVRF
jgi:serine/threonine protein kinase